MNYIPDIGKAGKIDRLCNPFTMLSLDSADTGISETGEKTRRVRYVRFAVYFHMGTREWAKRSGGKEKERKCGGDRDGERQERQHVRPTSVESDETLLDSAPGISRGNGGLILRRKFLTSRTFEPGRGEAFKVLSSRRFPDAQLGPQEMAEYRNACSISINSFGRSNA